jgi:hypothetical protein
MWAVMNILAMLVNMYNASKIQEGDSTHIRQMTKLILKATEQTKAG